ncbi:unnamed protein product, partial [Candidula unifasciata]
MSVTGAPPLLLWVGAVWFGVVFALTFGHRANGSPRSGMSSSETLFGFAQSSYSGAIYENSGAKEYIQTTQKMGIHLGHPGGLDVEYSITDGDPNSIFTAEAVTVKDFSFLRIRTQTANYWMLNRERNSHFHLRVQARITYPGDITVVNYTNVNITVLDLNEFSPLFPTQPYEVNIPEDTPLFRSIGHVKASDADSGINGEIYYSFARETHTFAIHPTTGVISLTGAVRFKQQARYELEILAKDRGEPTSSRSISPNSRTTFTVDILPVNFNPPTINIHNHQTLIEHGNIGSLFAVLTVTDEDHGSNGEISSVAITNDPKRIFSLAAESANGKFNIMVVSTIDRETMPVDYNITITAVDKGLPPLTASVVVPVRVQDINDNPPEFEQSVYSVEISEIVPMNTPVVFVKAHDRDMGANAEVLYSIADGNKNNFFSIDPQSGLIRTAGQLDADMDMRVSLIVQAQDQANSGSRKTGQTRVVIVLKDYNDNSPVFNMALNYINVKENMPRGSRVTTVLANDEDSGDNGTLSYSIVNYDRVPFEIDPFSGEITTTEVLDFETMQRNYDIVVGVSDWGTPFRREDSMVLTVRLEDVNDNSPEFERTRCQGYLSRESPLKMDVVTLTAIDFDSGNIITYSITEGNADNCFSIVSSTGTITVNCDLSSYREDIRTLTIVASDSQHVSIPTTVNLTLVNNNRNPALASDYVRVSCQKTDVASRLQQQMQKSKLARMNEQIVSHSRNKQKNNAPTLSGTFPAYVEISEGADIGSVVLDFGTHVTDQDSGYDGKLVFVISGGNDPHGAFKLDSFTGKLQVLSPLDFEEKSEYTITLTAMDLGQPPMQMSVDVRVVVLDDNDNTPTFEQAQYSRVVSENTPVDSVVLQVKATDLDSGMNSEIEYSILSGGSDFTIDPVNGFIKIKRGLDRESRSVYRLTIQAKDSGLKAKLASTTTVTITITDINDNTPLFVPEKYLVRVREELPVGAIITTLAARDLDEGDNGRVSYSFAQGSEESFDLDSTTGSIRIKRLLDYEIKQVYNLTVIVTDHGEPALSSSCLVMVEVMDVDENRFPPVFPDFLANGSVPENLPIGSYVMHIQADDQDDPRSGVGQIFYTIQEGSGLGRFTIDVN